MKIKILLVASFFSLSFVIFSAYSAPAHASILDSIKDFFTRESKEDKGIKDKSFTINSTIELAPDGDIDKNGEIDTGDIVRFTYVISNNTSEDYKFVTFRTNIQREKIHFIHNVSGVTGLKDDGETITFPNLRISSGSQAIVGFDAQINYNDEDLNIDTEPEIIDLNNKSIVKSSKHSIKANKLTKDEITDRLKKRSIFKTNNSI